MKPEPHPHDPRRGRSLPPRTVLHFMSAGMVASIGCNRHEWKSDLVIVSPGNAYEKSNPLSQEWTTRYDQLLKENSSLQLGVLHFPWGAQPEGSEAALSNWITNNTIFASRMSLLEQSAMSSLSSPEVQQTMQGRKSFHFACGLGKIKVENDNIRAVEPTLLIQLK